MTTKINFRRCILTTDVDLIEKSIIIFINTLSLLNVRISILKQNFICLFCLNEEPLKFLK